MIDEYKAVRFIVKNSLVGQDQHGNFIYEYILYRKDASQCARIRMSHKDAQDFTADNSLHMVSFMDILNKRAQLKEVRMINARTKEMRK